PSSQWGMFLRNHDELDLGRLTPKQRQCVFDAFGPEPEMQLYNRGIRRRLAPMLRGDRPRLELAYSLMLTLPGTPVRRYGDEIGMGDDLTLPERECARTPMQWSDEPNGGFSTAAKTARPVITGGPYGFEHLNVAAQRRDPNSMLNWLERMCRMRKEVPEVGWGEFKVLPMRNPAVLAIRYEWRNNAVLFLHNLCDEPIEVSLPAQESHGKAGVLVNLLSEDHSLCGADAHHYILLERYGYRWYRVGGLDYLLERSDV
ncbi:MAG: trehalose synthase, partial [Caldimonas sp.]